MFWTLELASHLEDAPWPATKDELIDYSIRSGAPIEVVENLQELEDDAEIYESLGGSVRWIGKPHREMYDVAMRAWGNPARSTVVCVGDSIAHDIKGAQDAQLASVLVRTGILSDASESDLEDAFATTGA